MRLIVTLAAAVACAWSSPLPTYAQEEVTFPSADGATIYADRYPHEGEHSRGTALLFHDEAGNAQEYADIAPRLAAMGFDAIAVDTRTGANMYGGTNRTLAGLPAPPSFYDDGLQDVQAALAWARQEMPDNPIVIWGSGPSADMAIVTAADDPNGIAGILAFSPFSMLMRSDEAEAASRLTVPLYVTYGTTPTNELATISKITDAAPTELLTLHTPELGAYGVTTVTQSGNPNGWEANWAAVEEFLNRVAPPGGA